MDGQISMMEAEETEEYRAFVEKFKPKKTTDDCYTPQNVYEAVRDWAVQEYGLEGREIVRPFWPGGDYERFAYPDGCVVIDNPPFSILAKIVKFYNDRGIRFFLFCNGLTAFGLIKDKRASVVCVGSSVVYDNGANVNTNFVTNLAGDILVESACDLHDAIMSARVAID